MSSPSSAAARTPSASRTRFYHLPIAQRREETADACSFLFDIPPEHTGQFAFRPGQHLVLRETLNGQEERRTYSLCGTAGELRVLVKRVPGGLFSNHALDSWQEGDTIESMRPQGQFGLAAKPESLRRYLAVAAGSGITPVISILEGLLAAEPDAQATLLYANKTSGSIIFCDRLADLKDTCLSRFAQYHVLSREKTEEEILHGRIDESKLEQFAQTLVPFDDFDHVFLCGPEGMMNAVRSTLAKRKFPASQVHSELFTADRGLTGDAPKDIPAPRGAVHCQAAVIIDGIRRELEIDTNQTVLEAAKAAKLDLPFSCRGGVCATCRAQLLEGEVAMRVSHALDNDEREKGFVLTCQSVPTSASITLDFDRT